VSRAPMMHDHLDQTTMADMPGTGIIEQHPKKS
jgi:hypothetical protein